MQTEQQTREQWLAGLKVGDEVAVQGAWRTLRVKRIVAIRDDYWEVDGDLYRKPTGINRVGKRIVPVCSEAQSQTRHANAIEEFDKLAGRSHRYSTATLEAAIAVLKGEGKE